MSSGSSQDLHLVVVQMNAVREHDMRCCKPAFLQVLDVTMAGLLFDHFYLVLVLGGVSVNHYPALARQPGHAFQQLAGTTDCEAGRKAVTYSAVGTALPTFKQRNRFRDRSFSLLPKRRRHIVALVHHALAHGGAKTGLLNRGEHCFRVVDRFHRQRAGGPTVNQLGYAQASRCVNGFSRVRGFHWPYFLREPIDQSEVIRRSSKKRLAQMDVSLHEPRQQYEPSRRDHRDAPVLTAGKRRAERTDAPVFQKHVALEDVVLAVQGDYSRTFD